MSVSEKCASKGHSLLRFYQYVYELGTEIDDVPHALRPNGMVGAIKDIAIGVAEGDVENLFRTGAIDEKTYHSFRSHLQDIGGRLPPHLEPGLPESKIEDLLEQSKQMTIRLQNEVEDALYQTVVHCECKKETKGR